MITYNQQAFYPDEYGANPVKKSLKNTFLIMQNTPKTEATLMMLSEETLESDETFFNPGWFSPREETFYRLEKSPTPLIAENSNSLISLNLLSSNESWSYSRSIYNF